MSKKINKIVDNTEYIDKPIEQVLHDSMLPYSEYVILSRAIPRLEDGLKPVQRRIIYSMYELGLTPDKPYRKSARIVGDCLGKYHPHGDTSIYEAMVNMAQEFTTRNPLVDGQGNYGSVDGDGAAAMRYTEAKLTPLSLQLVRDIEKDTVRWSYNFDDTLMEPEFLPSRYPNLLVNGAAGIAVGMATKIPPHNLHEVIDATVAYIDNNQISVSELLEYIKGPDFPTAGQIIVTKEDLENIYTTGRGSIKMQATFKIEKDGNKNSMVITEIPYQVNKADLLMKIRALKDDKNTIFSDISDVYDESDRDGMRAIVQFKKGANAKKIVKALLNRRNIDLQKNFPVNLVAIGQGRPMQFSLKDALSYYVEFQREVIVNRTKYDLEKAKEREHILLGLVIAIENIHEVINIIKGSDSTISAKAELKRRYLLSERQAQAILDMRLARLAKLEVTKLKEEIKYLQELIKKYQAIIASKRRQYSLLKQELLEIKKQFKAPRLTNVVYEGSVAADKMIVTKDINELIPKEGNLILGYDSSFRLVSNKSLSMSQTGVSEISIQQRVKQKIYANNSCDILCFTNMANAFTFNIDDVVADKFRSTGTTAQKLNPQISTDEVVISMFSLEEIKDKDFIIFTKLGQAKISSASEYMLDKKHFEAAVLNDEDEIINVEILNHDSNIIAVTSEGMILNYEQSNIPKQGRRSRGVRGIRLNDGDYVINSFQVSDEGECIVVTSFGYSKRLIVGLIDSSVRDRKGLKVSMLSIDEGERVIFSSYVKNSYNLALELSDSESLQAVNTEDIEISSRSQKGNKILKITDTTKIESIVIHDI